jgi:hypothetical protein
MEIVEYVETSFVWGKRLFQAAGSPSSSRSMPRARIQILTSAPHVFIERIPYRARAVWSPNCTRHRSPYPQIPLRYVSASATTLMPDPGQNERRWPPPQSADLDCLRERGVTLRPLLDLPPAGHAGPTPISDIAIVDNANPPTTRSERPHRVGAMCVGRVQAPTNVAVAVCTFLRRPQVHLRWPLLDTHAPWPGRI